MLAKIGKNRKDSGQTMVEFALALPVVLALVFGVIEFGFLLWSYSSVNSAAREAARYGIAIGDGTVAGQRYYDCAGIKNAAMRVGSFAGMEADDVLIHYDSGPNTTTKYATCEDLAAFAGDDTIEFGDRIVVSVTHDYQPIAALIGFNIQPFNMVATSNRTIVKSAEVVASGNGTGGTGGTPACFSVTTSHTGDGSDPTISPSQSSGCNLYEYLAGEDLTLSASPAIGWSVAGWSGTDNDASSSTTNTVSMPGGSTEISVTYFSGTPTCYSLSLSSNGTGSGSGPTASPTKSAVCGTSGTYVSGEVITLTATPNAGSAITGWSGTTNNASTSSPNTVSMPAGNHSASVTFDIAVPVCYSLSVSHTGNGSDPVPSASNCTGGTYVSGTLVTLNATADSGYDVSGWSGTDNDGSTSNTNTVTMTSNKSVSVAYVVSTVLDPPVNIEVADWKWQNGQKQCQRIDLSWTANPGWAPLTPVKYEVFNGSTSWGYITSAYWDANLNANMGELITVGVRAIFAGGVTSRTQEVTYACFENSLVLWGSVVK